MLHVTNPTPNPTMQEKPKNRKMITILFDSFTDPDVLNMLMPLIRSHAASLVTRFQWGTLKEFHVGGKYYDAAAAEVEWPELVKAPVNTDSIERSFGVHSDKKAALNGNTALNSVSGCATYVGNNTSD